MIHNKDKIIINLQDLEHTQKIAHIIARVMKEHDIIILSGEVGTGKTSFAKFLIQKLCHNQNLEVISPTFSIVQIYNYEQRQIWHADLYRLKTTEEIFETGIYDMLEEVISIIEWPEKIIEYLPQSYLKIHFTYDNDIRKMTIEKYGDWSIRELKYV